MNPVLTFVIALLVILFHTWASRRSPRYWYLGGIVPLIWLGLVVFLWSRGQIDLPADLRILIVPTVLLLLIWLQGSQAAKKKELERMKAKDLL